MPSASFITRDHDHRGGTHMKRSHCQKLRSKVETHFQASRSFPKSSRFTGQELKGGIKRSESSETKFQSWQTAQSNTVRDGRNCKRFEFSRAHGTRHFSSNGLTHTNRARHWRDCGSKRAQQETCAGAVRLLSWIKPHAAHTSTPHPYKGTSSREGGLGKRRKEKSLWGPG